MDIEKFNSCFKTLETTSQEIKKVFEDGLKELSEIDSKCNDLYHYIELGKYDAVQGWKLLKELRGCLEQRRKVKDVIEIIQSVSQSLESNTNKYKKNILERKKALSNVRTYHYRTDVVSKTLNIEHMKKLKSMNGRQIKSNSENKE